VRLPQPWAPFTRQACPLPLRFPPIPAEVTNPGVPCPSVPVITCSKPACTSAGQVVPLLGTCTAQGAPGGPTPALIYLVGGQPALYATCPAPGATVEVSVKPMYPARPDCPYNATLAYALNSERPSGPQGGAGGWGVNRSCCLALSCTTPS
jgi:hypothetical protein